ncbi:MAG: hypothetical protein AAFW98_15495, partial [Pseudomonadota bacterium]
MDDIPFAAKARMRPDPSPQTQADGAAHAPIPHDSGHKHVAGTAIYADDIPEPVGMVHVHIATAGFACGTVTVDLAKVER